MRTRFTSSRVLTILALSLTAVFLMSAKGEAGPPGLNADARTRTKGRRRRQVPRNVRGNRKLTSAFGPSTRSTPVRSDDTYPSGVRPDGPVCIAGTDYSVFTKAGDPKKVLIFLQGGGACWQGFYNCNVLADDQAPPDERRSLASSTPATPTTRMRTTRSCTCRTVTDPPSVATTT